MPGDIDRYLDIGSAVQATAICLAVALVVGGVCYRLKGAAVATRVAGWLVLAGSIVVVLAVTFRGRLTFGSSGAFAPVSNWVPLRGIVNELHNVNHALGIVNIVGNVALFVPTGLLAGLLFRPRRAAFLLAPVLSTCIEITQSYAGLSADIDDIILNTLGGAIGVAAAMITRRLLASHASAMDSPTLNRSGPPQ